MESSIKDKYIILGFVGFAIVLISSIATLVIADSFNQDNFVRWIVFVCCNLLGWLLYLSFQTLIFDTIAALLAALAIKPHLCLDLHQSLSLYPNHPRQKKRHLSKHNR